MTGGLLVAVLLVIEVLMSWTENGRKKESVSDNFAFIYLHKLGAANLTSSSFSMIMEKALNMEVVGPARVMILSGQFPSEMLIRAPLFGRKDRKYHISCSRSHTTDGSTPHPNGFTHDIKQGELLLPPLSSS